MEVNFFALVEMTRLALPLLKQGVKPIVVNVSSILGHRGVPHSSEYSASKFAVQGFSEAIRAEFTRLGIDVLVVSPGTTETEFFDRVIERTADAKWPEHKPVSAARVARQTVRAIRSGRHEIIPYRWGRVLCWLNRLSPRLVDGLMARYCVDAWNSGFQILYEEGPCLVVCKPPGLPTQAPPGIDSLEVRVKAFLKRARQRRRTTCIWACRTGSIGRPPGRWSSPPAAAPRRSWPGSSSIATVKKLYWAWVEGRPDPPAGTWQDYLRKVYGKPQAEVVPADHPEAPAGRAALPDAWHRPTGARGWRSNWRPAARTRSASKRPRAGIPCSATSSTARRSPSGRNTPTSACGRSRCTPGRWSSGIRRASSGFR